METRIDEIAPDLYRVSTYVAKIDLQFNQFLVNDDEPLLYHTGLRGLFPQVRDAVARVIDPATIRWISFSHFEADECGSLNEWRALAPHAEPVCGAIGALVNINDYIGGRARVMAPDETLVTGRHRFRLIETPHVPHGWDGCLLFEETGVTLFCSDLFLQNGDLRPLTDEDVVGPARQSLLEFEAGPLPHSIPYMPSTDATLQMLASLGPKLLAIMHGSSFIGNGGTALRELAGMLAATLGGAVKREQDRP
jgi:flavorubredoxin